MKHIWGLFHKSRFGAESHSLDPFVQTQFRLLVSLKTDFSQQALLFWVHNTALKSIKLILDYTIWRYPVLFVWLSTWLSGAFIFSCINDKPRKSVGHKTRTPIILIVCNIAALWGYSVTFFVNTMSARCWFNVIVTSEIEVRIPSLKFRLRIQRKKSQKFFHTCP